MLGTVLGLLVIGLVAGSIARAIVPSRQKINILLTILFGSGDSLSSPRAGPGPSSAPLSC